MTYDFVLKQAVLAWEHITNFSIQEKMHGKNVKKCHTAQIYIHYNCINYNSK